MDIISEFEVLLMFSNSRGNRLICDTNNMLQVFKQMFGFRPPVHDCKTKNVSTVTPVPTSWTGICLQQLHPKSFLAMCYSDLSLFCQYKKTWIGATKFRATPAFRWCVTESTIFRWQCKMFVDGICPPSTERSCRTGFAVGHKFGRSNNPFIVVVRTLSVRQPKARSRILLAKSYGWRLLIS